MHRSSSYYLSSSSSSSSSMGAASVTGGPSGNAGLTLTICRRTTRTRTQPRKRPSTPAAPTLPTLVHLVPIVVLLSGLLLWSLSTTPVHPTEVGVILLKKERLMALKSGLEHSSNGPGMVVAMENLDPAGNTVGKRIKKDGLKK
ncbi:hypothetical protein ZWY2020_010838 [Hordeum vulgare]|nr:hypothetical protein ZWY2020_010838 [Hordeum vulgare]